MGQLRIPAVFMRGGTSRAVVFHARDLPDERRSRDEIFLAALGSPDPNGRQLDGMGGGISSLSKVCVVGPPTHPDADVDYTFAQVSVREATVHYSGNCGNMSSAIGPFAVDEGLVRPAGARATVRIHNTNTKKLIHAHFPVEDGRAAVDGDLAIPGVSGTGAPIRLEFFAPGGASTGKLLPTGAEVDTLDVPGLGRIRASLVDASNACVFVHAADLGLAGTEMPDELDRATELLPTLEAIRSSASVAMGLAETRQAATSRRPGVPMIGFVSPPQDAPTLAGESLGGDVVDLSARMLSMGQPHRALPLTGALCLAVAARIAGTVAHEVTRASASPGADLRIGMPSGVLVVGAKVRREGEGWVAEQAAFYRTARRLFEGAVLVRVRSRDSRLALRQS
ncbi:MAG: PrpF family protein [Gemmatimonadetes bacterium]|nr:PrpF family protein [Gemmatimonadota bacterium]